MEVDQHAANDSAPVLPPPAGFHDLSNPSASSSSGAAAATTSRRKSYRRSVAGRLSMPPQEIPLNDEDESVVNVNSSSKQQATRMETSRPGITTDPAAVELRKTKEACKLADELSAALPKIVKEALAELDGKVDMDKLVEDLRKTGLCNDALAAYYA